ncbi:hypothetical protein, partial [Micromonospora sp. NPDC051296]|uniref:hypothetical protein n=1 Tax=Micromonospora sp. NPDC051296 TaxID=3155046 RepID=UPI00342C1B98
LSGAVGLLLILTSIGTFTADGAWLFAGLLGLPIGMIWCLAAVIEGPRRFLRRNPQMLAPVRCRFTADAIEWHTAVDVSLRLPWTAIKQIRRGREAYRLDCADQNEPRYLCRTTLTPAEDAQVAAYLDERLAAKTSAQPSPPSANSQ